MKRKKKLGRYRFKTKPRGFQVRALKKLLRNRGGGLFMPMRSGKTKVALDFVGCAYQRWGYRRVLVVCPLSVRGVWANEIRKHLPDDVRKKVKFKVINYENLFAREYNDPDNTRSWEAVDNEELIEFDAQIIILDESHRIGNASGVSSKKAYKLGKNAELKLIMTGTPAHRKPFALFGQFKFFDENILGSNFGIFKKQYGVWGGYGNYQLLKYRNLRGLRRKIAPHVFYMKYVPERPPMHEPIPVYLEESRDIYEEMALDAVARVGDTEVEAPLILTQHLRLQQIAGGWVKHEGKYHRVGEEKRRALSDLLSDMGESGLKKLVIFSRFIPELRDIGEVCKEQGFDIFLLHGGVEGDRREQRIAAFDEHPGRAVFISQVSTGSMGIDLSSADTALFYSMPVDPVDFDQAKARIRKWKDKRPLTYYYLLGRGTRDEVTYMAHKLNLDVVDLLLNHPELMQGELVG